MAKFKNNELMGVLLMLAAYDKKTGVITRGLLNETMSLGLRRRLQKIRNAFLAKHNEFMEDLKPLDTLPDGEEKTTELNRLFNEEVEVSFDPADMSMIEAIETSINYDMDLLEKITK